jgi:hypothetical protein
LWLFKWWFKNDPMDYHEYLHNVKWRLAKKNWFFFANCFSPEGERYQSFSLPDASKWYDISTFQLPWYKGIQYSLAKDDIYIDNYYSKIEKIKKLLNDWSLRPFNICICFKFQSTALSGPNPNYLCFIKICSQSRTGSNL